MVPVRSELTQPLLPSVLPTRLYPSEAKVPTTSGPLVVAELSATIVLPMVTAGATHSQFRRRWRRSCRRSCHRLAGARSLGHEEPAARVRGLLLAIVLLLIVTRPSTVMPPPSGGNRRGCP